MGHHSCCNQQKVKRGLWSPEEDEKLVRYITNFGYGCWSEVPEKAGQSPNYFSPDTDFSPFEMQSSFGQSIYIETSSIDIKELYFRLHLLYNCHSYLYKYNLFLQNCANGLLNINYLESKFLLHDLCLSHLNSVKLKFVKPIARKILDLYSGELHIDDRWWSQCILYYFLQV